MLSIRKTPANHAASCVLHRSCESVARCGHWEKPERGKRGEADWIDLHQRIALRSQYGLYENVLAEQGSVPRLRPDDWTSQAPPKQLKVGTKARRLLFREHQQLVQRSSIKILTIEE